MRRPGPSRQQGFGLLVFVIATAIVAFTIVVGYAGNLTRKQLVELVPRQNKQLDISLQLVEKMWLQNAYYLDYAAGTRTIDEVLQLAAVDQRGGMLGALSDVMTIPAEGIAYRALVLYFPTGTDGADDENPANPPDLAHFKATGEFKSCADPGAPCAERVFRVFNSVDVERALAKETSARLQRIAQKAQSYFKARMLQDPERNISVNYFRRPSGGCEVFPQDLGCLDTYEGLVTMSSSTTYVRSRIATILGLNDEELFSAWGQPIEASNLQDSSVAAAPFSMALRARKPLGGFMTIKAIQPI